ncbi:MAG: cytochrome c oxidase subunit II [Cyanobacteria bacterium]|nr:cytochrome c oxidase subunit II [Cyanobacteriota bacterium]
MTFRASVITFLVSVGLILVGLAVGQRVDMLPLQASVNAPVYDELFQVLFSIGTMLFLGICGMLVYSLVRFRRPAGDLGDGAAIEGNLPLEIVWTAIPAVVVLFVGLYSYNIYERMGGMAPLADHSVMHAMPASDPGSGDRVWGGISTVSGESADLTVDVTALQFAFIFHYPDGNITTGELHVPEGERVELRMKANDVIHAFWVPQFRIKQDIIPGQPTVLTFTANRPGTYPIICAELCGPYHGGMRTSVVVHDRGAFDQWLTKNTPPVA